MTRDDIEAHWQIVVRHRAAVVRFLETAGTSASARRRKVSRRQVVDGYDESHDIPRLAAMFGMSASGIGAILARAIRVARGFESGTLRQPKPRKTFTLTLTDLPAALVKDIDEWAKMRSESRGEAARELIKIGLDVTSARVEKQIAAALAVVRRARKRQATRLPVQRTSG